MVQREKGPGRPTTWRVDDRDRSYKLPVQVWVFIVVVLGLVPGGVVVWMVNNDRKAVRVAGWIVGFGLLVLIWLWAFGPSSGLTPEQAADRTWLGGPYDLRP